MLLSCYQQVVELFDMSEFAAPPKDITKLKDGQSWADLDDDEDDKKPTEPQTPASKTVEEVKSEKSSDVEKKEDKDALTKAEKDKIDVDVMSGMLSQLGSAPASDPVVVNDGQTSSSSAAPEEELQLLQPYESHVSELMFTDPVFKM